MVKNTLNILFLQKNFFFSFSIQFSTCLLNGSIMVSFSLREISTPSSCDMKIERRPLNIDIRGFDLLHFLHGYTRVPRFAYPHAIRYEMLPHSRLAPSIRRKIFFQLGEGKFFRMESFVTFPFYIFITPQTSHSVLQGEMCF